MTRKAGGAPCLLGNFAGPRLSCQRRSIPGNRRMSDAHSTRFGRGSGAYSTYAGIGASGPTKSPDDAT
eukprot:7269557-Pyramimonas_sp.AAC.1